MGQRLSESDLKLYKSIDEILWKDWDPAGIQGAKEARDEYYMYLPKVFSMAKEDISAQEISSYLFSIENERMGLPGNEERCNKVARLVLEEKKKFSK